MTPNESIMANNENKIIGTASKYCVDVGEQRIRLEEARSEDIDTYTATGTCKMTISYEFICMSPNMVMLFYWTQAYIICIEVSGVSGC